VFRAEEMINEAGIECKVVPTPVQDKAYCGVCVKTNEASAKKVISDMEYEVIE
jgi:hypothetical protein